MAKRKTQAEIIEEHKQYFKHQPDPELVYCPQVIIEWEWDNKVVVCESMKAVGYMPIFLNKEEAEEAYPGRPIKEHWLADVQ